MRAVSDSNFGPAVDRIGDMSMDNIDQIIQVGVIMYVQHVIYTEHHDPFSQCVRTRTQGIIEKRVNPSDTFGEYLSGLPSQIMSIVETWRDAPRDAGLEQIEGDGGAAGCCEQCPKLCPALQSCVDKRNAIHDPPPHEFMEAATLYTSWSSVAFLDTLLRLLEPHETPRYWDGRVMGRPLTDAWRTKAADWATRVCHLASQLPATSFTTPVGTGDVYRTQRNGKEDGRHIEFTPLTAGHQLSLLFWIFRNSSCKLVIGPGDSDSVTAQTSIARVAGLPVWCRQIGVGIIEGDPDAKVAVGAQVTPHAGILQAGLFIIRRLNGFVEGAGNGIGYIKRGVLCELPPVGWKHCFDSAVLLALGVPFHDAFMKMPRELTDWETAQRKDHQDRAFAHGQQLHPVGFKFAFNHRSLGFAPCPPQPASIVYHGRRHVDEPDRANFTAKLVRQTHGNVCLWDDYSHILPQLYLGIFTSLPALWAVMEADRQRAGLPPFVMVSTPNSPDVDLLSFLKQNPLLNMPISTTRYRKYELRQLWAVGGMKQPQNDGKKKKQPAKRNNSDSVRQAQPAGKRRRQTRE